MAIVDDLIKSESAKGAAIGVGIALLAPVVLPVVAAAARPLARAAVKTGLLLYEKGRETAAELGEVVDDLVAEARAEIEDEYAAAGAAAARETTEEVDAERPESE